MTGWGAIGEDESEAGYRRVGERGATLTFHFSLPSLGSEAPWSPLSLTHSTFSCLFSLLLLARRTGASPFLPDRNSEVPGRPEGVGTS